MRAAARALGLAVCVAGICAGTARADKLDASISTDAPHIKGEPLQSRDSAPSAQPDAKSQDANAKPQQAPAERTERGTAPFFLATPALPDTGTFDWMLFDLARPVDGKARGLTTSSSFVALSANAPIVLPETKASDLAVIRNPALNATVGSVPAGSSVLGFFAPPQTDIDGMKLREVGKLVIDQDGTLARAGRRLLGDGILHDVVIDGVGAVVSAGLMARLGTAQAQGLLGYDPSTHFKFFGGTYDQRVAFHCDPKLKNPGVDLSSQIHVLHITSPSVSPLLRDAYLEGGVTVQRGLAPSPIPVRWGKLHLVDGHFDGGFIVYDPPTTPPVLSIDGVATAGRYRLHLNVARENHTGVLGATSDLITKAGPVQYGLFFGGKKSALGASDRGFTTGVIAMMVF